METISVQNLSFFYGQGDLRNHVLKGISLEIKKGDIVIMTGPSGSGKTTLLTILGGLREAYQGSVKVLGQELVNASDDTRMQIRRQTGYIFQQHNLLPPLTAIQNVCMSLEIETDISECERQKKAIEMLKAVGLGERLHYRPSQLSGGQRQRVSIARALVGSPKLVLADEPTASLDKTSGMEAIAILKKLAKEAGTTILLVTHDYRILDMADHVITMEDGVLIEQDTSTDQVYPLKHHPVQYDYPLHFGPDASSTLSRELYDMLEDFMQRHDNSKNRRNN